MIGDKEEISKEEGRGTTGSVTWSLYMEYFLQGIGWILFIFLLLVLLLGQVCINSCVQN